MPFSKIITLDNDLKFDFTNSESTIDYLIYITQPLNYSLIIQNMIMLGHKDAVKEFYEKTTPTNYQRIYMECNLSLIPFDNIFIDNELNFIFQDFLFDDSISKLKRKTKLNTLVNNFNQIIKYILIQTHVKKLKKLEKSEVADLVKIFRNKFPSGDFVHSKPSAYFADYVYPITLPLLSHNLMLYCIGYRFIAFHSKLLNDFSSFLNNLTHQQLTSGAKTNEPDNKQTNIEDKINELPQKTPENPHPRIFLNNDVFLLFEELKTRMCAKERTQLADYSFVFRKLQKNELIYPDITEKSFRDFLFNQYGITIEKLKTLEYCTTDSKEALYNLLRT